MKVHRRIANLDININEKDDFMAAGGEGSIYLIKDHCYKITLRPFVEAKLAELMNLVHPNIAVPIDFLEDKKNALVGYVLKYVDGDPLCRLFNTDYWNDNGIDVNFLSPLVQKIIEVTQFVHDKGFLVVDWNEMNFLTDHAHTLPYFIDTNAWKTNSFPPDAVTPMFRDHSTKDFTKLTDWYGVGILLFKLYVGIHPFKGSHPKYGRKLDDTLKRMVDNVSALNKGVTLPAAARPFDQVPDSYLKWFIDLFEKGKRIPPPNVAGYVTVIKKRVDSIFKCFESEIFKLYQHDVRRYYNINGSHVMFSDDVIVIDDKVIPIKNKKVKVGVVISPRDKVPYFVFALKGKLYIYDNNGNPVAIDTPADDFLIHDHVIYALFGGKVVQLTCTDIGGKQVFSFGERWDVMPKSTKILGSVITMSVMGNAHLLVPSQIGGNFFLKNVRVPELDKYKILMAKFDKNVVGVVAEKDGRYDRFMFFLRNTSDTYFLLTEQDIASPFINFVVLDNGIGCSMDENAHVKIFSTNPDKYQEREIIDDSIKSTFRLFKSGTTVLFADGKKLFSLKVGKNS